MKSIFTDKAIIPTEKEVEKALCNTYPIWKTLTDFTKKMYPESTESWHFSGDKYGWSFRISDKKRVLLYLLPRDGFFKTAFVFGQKATDKISDSAITQNIKDEIQAAKVYAEGRGIRITVNDKSNLDDIKKLITIKILN